MFIAAIFKIVKLWDSPKCLSKDEEIKKGDTHREALFNSKEE